MGVENDTYRCRPHSWACWVLHQRVFVSASLSLRKTLVAKEMNNLRHEKAPIAGGFLCPCVGFAFSGRGGEPSLLTVRS